MTGRRDLGGGGPLHLWNIQNTPGTPGQDATDSEMQGVRFSARSWFQIADAHMSYGW